jgi:hypothetical protein
MSDNVVVFTQSLNWHAAAHHVLGLALVRATRRQVISADSARGLHVHAGKNFDVGELRHVIGLVLADTHAAETTLSLVERSPLGV